ncbi:PREDICTED: uncharacterized protein LOC104713381 [Camelina sativa]|uniref:Uncharacterized protein LOC104713381 n=1 Tax=Camelina sativa TaxID=90675 RepID=A0ABM0TN45_CAMSA|nr:PREDICTED: uncharacterized protein LOC104713381 [Camelina sativa]
MGSLGEEELEKLVLDYIESSPITVSDHTDKSSTALITLQEILGEKGQEEKNLEEKIESFLKRKRLSYEGDDEKRDVMKKIVSKLRSYGYDASFSKTSWDSSFDHLEGCRVFRCTRKYEYIDVMVKGDGDGDDIIQLRRVIVDLDFKSQFELAKQTKAYKDMTELLPRVFVATEERLRRVVSLVCGEMKKSMEKEGMSRPPWRTSRYMQSKWLPENRRRVSRCKKGSWSWSVFDDDGSEEARSWTVSGSGSKTKCCFPIF